MKYFLLWVLCASLLDFALMGVDKWKARHDRWRVPERAFFCVALLGGTPGLFASLPGMDPAPIQTDREAERYRYRRVCRNGAFWAALSLLPALLLVQLALGTWIAIRVF